MNGSYWFLKTTTENFENIDVNSSKLETNIDNSPMFCNKGQYLDSKMKICDTCPMDTYQDKTNHRRINCEPHGDSFGPDMCSDESYFFQTEQKVRELKATIKDRQLGVDDMCRKHIDVKATDCDDGRYLNPSYFELRKSFKTGPLTKDNQDVCIRQPTFEPNKVCSGGTYFDTDKFAQLKNKTKNRALTEDEIKKSVCTPHAIAATDCDVRTYFNTTKYNNLSKEKQLLSTMKNTVCVNQDTLVAGQCADGTYFYEAGLDTLPRSKKATTEDLKKAACKPHNDYKTDLKNAVKASGKFFSENKWNSRMVSKSKLNAGDVSDDMTKCDMFHKVNRNTNACVECPGKHVQSETDPTVCSPYSSASGWVEHHRHGKPDHGVTTWGVLNGKATDLNKCIKYLKDNNVKDVSKIGRRTENHPDPAWKNSCWFYTKTSDNATNHMHSSRRTDNAHEMICIGDNLRPTPCVENSCPNGDQYIQTIDGNKYCSPQNTCPNGQELIGANINSAGTCRTCPAGKYKNSGQNRSGCSPHTICSTGQRLVGANASSAGTCEWIPVDCAVNWNNWGNCSASCGGGTQSRTFNVTRNAAHGGTACPRPESQQCNTQECPPPPPNKSDSDPTPQPSSQAPPSPRSS